MTTFFPWHMIMVRCAINRKWNMKKTLWFYVVTTNYVSSFYRLKATRPVSKIKVHQQRDLLAPLLFEYQCATVIEEKMSMFKSIYSIRNSWKFKESRNLNKKLISLDKSSRKSLIFRPWKNLNTIKQTSSISQRSSINILLPIIGTNRNWFTI